MFTPGRGQCLGLRKDQRVLQFLIAVQGLRGPGKSLALGGGRLHPDAPAIARKALGLLAQRADGQGDFLLAVRADALGGHEHGGIAL